MKYYHAHEYIKSRFQLQKPLLAFDEKQNFAEWREKAKDKLEELLGLPLERCDDRLEVQSDERLKEYRNIAFEFQSEEGYYIPAKLLIPNDNAVPLPTVICLQGHSTGSHISMGEEKFYGDANSIEHSDFAIQTVRAGYCAVVLDQRYMGRTGQAENGIPSCFTANRAMATLLLGRTAIGERVWDVQRLIDVLEKYFLEYVNVNRIVCLGNSGGGTASFYAGCLDERIYLTVPSCAVCTFEESIVPQHHCGCNYIPGIRKYFNMGDIGCLIAPRKFIQVNGIEDQLFWINGARECHEVIKKAYRKLGCIDKCQMVEGNGGHRFYPDDVWSLIKKELEV